MTFTLLWSFLSFPSIFDKSANEVEEGMMEDLGDLEGNNDADLELDL